MTQNKQVHSITTYPVLLHTHPVVGLPSDSPFSLADLFNLVTGSMLSNFCCSFEIGGGFSGMVGCTPSIHNQCAAMYPAIDKDSTNFPKNVAASPNSRCQDNDVKQVHIEDSLLWSNP